ncbi:MAG: 50S ribosomal protein L3 [Armatimonadota bacterium]|nr:50S ribosomal protein L3 [Armatimonadota bacterium]
MATVNGLLGRKVGMTSVFTAEGNVVPVTVIECGPCVVVQRKSSANEPEKSDYETVQLGYLELKPTRKDNRVPRGESGHRGRGEANKPLRGHFEKHGGAAPTRHLAEFDLSAPGDEPTPGDTLTVDALFKAGDAIKIQGTSKGRGFTGAMKRHGFSGQGASHGAKIHRKPASGGATDPARTFPGARRPGRMGAAKVTQRGLTVVEVDAGRNLLVVKGAVPGAPGGLLRIEKA